MAALFFLLLCIMPWEIGAGVKLHYLPLKVQQTSTLTLEINESLPVLHLSSQAKQILKFNLTPIPGEGAAALTKLPMALLFTLKDIFIDLRINQAESTFDHRTNLLSVPLRQLSSVIDRPLRLSIDVKGCLVDEALDIEKLLKEFPVLQKVNLKAFLHELLYHLFALTDKDLELGAKFEQTPVCKSTSFFPKQITYEITTITDQEIGASINGTLAPLNVILEAKLNIDEQHQEPVAMAVSGILQGEVFWERSNALLCRLQTTYHCQAKLTAGDMQWNLTMQIGHKALSSALP